MKKLLIVVIVCCAASPALSGDLPFKGGWYVPEAMRSTCGEANYQTYDWVLAFDSAAGTFGDSDGRCEVRRISFDARSSTYHAKWSCGSADGDDATSTTIATDGPRGEILAIDGAPYVRCEALR